MNRDWQSSDTFWIIGLVALCVLLMLSRGMVWLIPTVIIPGLLIALLFFFWKQWKSKKEQENDAAFELKNLSDHCENELDLLDKKLSAIDGSRAELTHRMRKDSTIIDDDLKRKTERLIAEYQDQASLISAKQAFYLDMKNRIDHLLTNHEWEQRLHSKKQELRDIRQGHYEDVEKMETLKQDVAYSTGFLGAIKALSDDIAATNSTLDIHELKKELERIMPKKKA